jgi:hypothetical protein
MALLSFRPKGEGMFRAFFSGVVLFAALWAPMRVSNVAAQQTTPSWPIRASANGRYLVDSAGKPFFYFATTPWMIGVNLSDADVRLYLDDRRASGVNVVQIMALPWEDNPQTGAWKSNGANILGQRPFSNENNFSTYNTAYFDRLSWVIDEARARGITVAFAPFWPGCCGESWIDEFRANSLDNLRAYGRFIGERFGQKDNLIWIMGGDKTPDFLGDDMARYDAMIAEIVSRDRDQLATFHAGAGESPRLVERAWRTLDGVYTYGPGQNGPYHHYVRALDGYNAMPPQPSIMLEGRYENEQNYQPWQLRRQAYWTVLSGASGHAYGHFYWNLSDDREWRNQLHRPAFEQLRFLKPMFETLPWWDLTPDQQHAWVIGGYGTYQNNTNDANNGSDYVTAGYSSDGRTLVAYLPPTSRNARAITINMAKFSAGTIRATWFNPVDNTRRDSGVFANAGSQSFTSPGDNGDATNDWVLILAAPSSAPTATPAPAATATATSVPPAPTAQPTLAPTAQPTLLPPSADCGDAIGHDNWRVRTVSSEEPLSYNDAPFAFDGAVNTAWHTAWVNATPAPPHELILDMGFSTAIACVSFIGRQDNPIGMIERYAFYASNDPDNWGEPVARGELAAVLREQRVTFANGPKSARYLRLVVEDMHFSAPVAALAELNVFAAVGAAKPVPLIERAAVNRISDALAREYRRRFWPPYGAFLPVLSR